jgi:16S rRNA (cytidine1402-2'-O)-methyltransferase
MTISTNKSCCLPNLYIVGTPIGNLQDMSPRAINILKHCDMILAEDTRHSIYLLRNFDIETPLKSYHQHNEAKRTAEIISLLKDNKTIALISDAGMPVISDPGYYIVKAALENNINISVIPGPSAITTAISISGIDCTRFCFEGFLPNKRDARLKALNNLVNEQRAIILYESPHRLITTIEDIIECYGPDRKITVLKELTKRYENIYHGTSKAVLNNLNNNCTNVIKGEYVIVISGNDNEINYQDQEIIKSLKICLAEDLSTKKAVQLISKMYSLNKNYVYTLALGL